MRAHKKARTVGSEPVANVSPTLADVQMSSNSALFYDVDTWLSDHAHRHFIGHEDSHSPTQDGGSVSPIDMVENSTHTPALGGDSAESHLQNQNALEIDLAGVGAFTLNENALTEALKHSPVQVLDGITPHLENILHHAEAVVAKLKLALDIARSEGL